jgi:type IV pilus assembly protein PilW
MLRKKPSRRPGNAGFSLIELMIAMVVGLIVVGAVLALVVSMIRANNQTIQATRLTQELRATAAVIASDLKRAKGVVDSFAAAKVAPADIGTIVPASGNANCIRYGYQIIDGAGNIVSVFHAVRLNANKVELISAATLAAATCATAGQQLSSVQVNITALTFTVTGRKLDVTLTGSLANPNSGADSITRTLTQTVFIRSIGS